MQPSAKGLAIVCALLAGAAVTGASEPPTAEIEADAQRLDYRWTEAGQLSAESFRMPGGVVAELAAIPSGGRLIVRDFPTAPGDRGDVVFERIDVYAAGARVWADGTLGVIEQPRSARVHLLGSSRTDPDVRVGLSLDPGGGGGTGLVANRTGVYGLWQRDVDDPTWAHYEIGASLEERLGIETQTTCDTRDSLPLEVGPSAPSEAPISLEPSGPSHEAVLAFDTDGEFLAEYGNDTGLADSAIGDLILSLNVIYERDLGLRLLQGETILRTNAATDPYTSGSTSGQLDEVRAWWQANQAAVERVWVALLSGKNPGSCSGAGIAWVDVYCNNSFSYSATQVIKCVSLSGSSNTRLIGHEVGHNAGSGHTHCYNPEVDQCYNAQGGCYGGPVSCPDFTGLIEGIAPNKGTIMSYCHFSPPNGAGCGSSESYFHPTVIARIQQSIDAATGSCVQLTGGDLSITKTDAEDPIGRGVGLTYTISVSNLGPSLATGVEVSDTLPTGTTLSSTTGCVEDPAGVPTCTLGDIASGESKSFDVTVFVEHSAPASLSNSASVSSGTNDPVAANDSVVEPTTVETWSCQSASWNLTAADNAALGPFVTEAEITAGSGYEVGLGETIEFRATTGITFENDFSVNGTLSATLDPLIDCP